MNLALARTLRVSVVELYQQSDEQLLRLGGMVTLAACNCCCNCCCCCDSALQEEAVV